MTLRTFFLMPDGRPRPFWRALLFVPAFLLIAAGLVILTVFAVGRECLQEHDPVQMVAQGMILVVPALLAAWVLLRLLDRRSFRTLGVWFYPGWGREFLWGCLLAILLITVQVGVLLALGKIEFQLASTGVLSALGGVALSFLLFLGPAAGEEFLFRGYLFQRLIDSWGIFFSVFFLSAVFGYLHMNNPSATPLSTANTVLAGILLALAYMKTRALWLPVGLHVGWNFVMGGVYSLPVSGFVIQPQPLMATISGPEWLSGGNYGPEGSVVCTGVLVGACLWLAYTRRIQVSRAQAKELQ